MGIFDRAARFLDDALLPDDARRALERSEALLAEGRAKEAEAAFRALLEARPGLGRALLGWGRSLVAMGDLDGARIAAAEAQRFMPDDPRVLLLSGQLALELGELGAALSAAREAARRLASEGGPELADACALRARVESRRGRPDRAARELRKAIAADPSRVAHRVALVVALAEAHERASALRVARELAEAQLDERAALDIGLALQRLREPSAARPWLERAASAGEPRALEGLGRVALDAGDARRAETQARMAIARGGGASALELLADALVSEAASAARDAGASQRAAEAAEALLAAASATNDPERFIRASRFVPLGDPRTIDRVADAADRVVPGLASTRALRAWSLLARGKLEVARSLLADPGTEPRAVLAAARLALLDGEPSRALEWLARLDAEDLEDDRRGALQADAALQSALRRDALRALWRGPDGEVDLAAAIDAVAAFARERALGEVERRSSALRDELDRPLLLAILGEFNAGKSTLVNAFLGADVAPTGILPTTATLNVLRGGAERRVRVVRSDGTTREGDHGEIRRLLEEAEAGGSSIDRVEITLPSELLERVWVLDTPGSNAPNPAHEALAAEALRRADVALWVFDAGQAGKASEGRILAQIRASRREVFAALNKVDRLAPDALERVTRTLAEAMPELAERLMPVSARRALEARLAGDAEADRASGFPALLELLDREVFERARPLKRRACAGRLFALLDDALATEPEALASSRRAAEAGRAATLALRALEDRLTSELDDALARLEVGQRAALAEAAREVLAFVRPRSGRFGGHDADPEDRAFLAELLGSRFEQVADRTAAELAARLAERVVLAAPSLGGDEHRLLVQARVAPAVSGAFAHFAGYQAGALDGGSIRRFFEEALPSITLSEAAIAEALLGLSASPRDTLRPRLEASLSAALDALVADVEAGVEASRRRVQELRSRTFEPLRALRDVLTELVA